MMLTKDQKIELGVGAGVLGGLGYYYYTKSRQVTHPSTRVTTTPVHTVTHTGVSTVTQTINGTPIIKTVTRTSTRTAKSTPSSPTHAKSTSYYTGPTKLITLSQYPGAKVLQLSGWTPVRPYSIPGMSNILWSEFQNIRHYTNTQSLQGYQSNMTAALNKNLVTTTRNFLNQLITTRKTPWTYKSEWPTFNLAQLRWQVLFDIAVQGYRNGVSLWGAQPFINLLIDHPWFTSVTTAPGVMLLAWNQNGSFYGVFGASAFNSVPKEDAKQPFALSVGPWPGTPGLTSTTTPKIGALIFYGHDSYYHVKSVGPISPPFLIPSLPGVTALSQLSPVYGAGQYWND